MESKGDAIEKAISAEDWTLARSLIQKDLDSDPDNHWLLTRLSLTYYEQRDYQSALQYSEQALALAPWCPLVLWDFAGTLEMLDRPEEALIVYESLIVKSVDEIASGDCGEGRGRARGLVADCHYRSFTCLKSLGRQEEALRAFDAHLDLRGPGCRSIYPLDTLHGQPMGLRR